MLEITSQLSVPDEEIEMVAIRAQGSGGQNVNKVASAVHLRFDLRASSLPESVKERLMCTPDQRISKSGVIVIKAQEHRTFEKNREAARQRLVELIGKATVQTQKTQAHASHPECGAAADGQQDAQRQVEGAAAQSNPIRMI